MKELPKTLSDSSKKQQGFRIVADFCIASYPAGACKRVIEVPEGPFAGFWIAPYSREEDWTDANQRMEWRRAKKVITETWVIDAQ